MNVIEEVNYGKIAYDAYCDRQNWKSIRGEPLPKFEAQREDIQGAWEAAARAVIEAYNS